MLITEGVKFLQMRAFIPQEFLCFKGSVSLG